MSTRRFGQLRWKNTIRDFYRTQITGDEGLLCHGCRHAPARAFFVRCCEVRPSSLVVTGNIG